MSQASQQPAARADATPQVTVNYPAGLGTSVVANFKNGTSSGSSSSNSVSLQNGDGGGTGPLQ